jgi:hypothetical protein
MDLRVRKVLARYFEEPGEYPPDMDKTWMEYLDGKSKATIDPNNPVIDMLKGKDHLDTTDNSSENITNPYEYESPSDKSKDQKDSPPFENVISDPTQVGYFDKPDMWSGGGILEEWNKSRQQDFTQDEDEQSPAISLTRKRLSSEIIPYGLLSNFVISGEEFYDFALKSKVAASLDEILNKDTHYKNDLKLQRAGRCQAVWANKNNPKQFERGLFIFKVTTPGSPYGSHNVYLQFLRDDDKPAAKYVDYPVHIGCTCPSFLFNGAQYYAVRDGYMYMPAFKPDLVAPRPENQYIMSGSGRKTPGRGLNARVCKHILSVFNEIKSTPIEIHYKKYPVTSPPSKKIDKAAWEKMMKFTFSEEEVKKRLLSSYPKVPGYFKRESVTPAVIEWFNNTWFPRTDEQKIKSLKEFAMFPERVYFILIEEAYLKRQKNDHISKTLVDAGFEMMNDVVQEDSVAEGQVIPEYDDGTIGTGKIDLPEGAISEDEVEDTKAEKKFPIKKIKKQYGLGTPKKVKQPEKLKRPSTVQPAIK